jgi:hypothetical protein
LLPWAFLLRDVKKSSPFPRSPPRARSGRTVGTRPFPRATCLGASREVPGCWFRTLRPSALAGKMVRLPSLLPKQKKRELRSVHWKLGSALFRMQASVAGWKVQGGLALACRWWPWRQRLGISRNRWRFEAGILPVAAGCQAVTVSGEPLPVHVARLPGLHANRWSRMEGDEPCHSGASAYPAPRWPSCGGAVCPLVFRTTWMVVRLCTRVTARALDSSVEPAMTNVSFCLGPRQAAGAVRRLGTTLLDGFFLLACPGFFRLRGASGCFGQVVGSSPPKRRGVRFWSGPGTKSISVCNRFFGLPRGSQ